MIYEYFKQEVENGHGDYNVFVTDDEEANGYHSLWFLGITPEEMSDDERHLYEDCNCDLSILNDNKHKAIYLG